MNTTYAILLSNTTYNNLYDILLTDILYNILLSNTTYYNLSNILVSEAKNNCIAQNNIYDFNFFVKFYIYIIVIIILYKIETALKYLNNILYILNKQTKKLKYLKSKNIKVLKLINKTLIKS